MDNEIRDLLGEEIKAQIDDLYSLEAGSREKSRAINDLATLYKLKIEEDKNKLDFEEKKEKRLIENDRLIEEVNCHEQDEKLKQEQLSEQIKERYFKLGIATAEIVLPLIFYASWMKKGFKFEETGTYTSTTFRGLFNRFRPTRK